MAKSDMNAIPPIIKKYSPIPGIIPSIPLTLSKIFSVIRKLKLFIDIVVKHKIKIKIAHISETTNNFVKKVFIQITPYLSNFMANIKSLLLSNRIACKYNFVKLIFFRKL